MKVFKLFFRLVKSNIGALISSLAVLIISVTIYFSIPKSSVNKYSESKIAIALKYEQEQPFIGDYNKNEKVNIGLKGYLSNYTDFKTVKGSIEDALYFGIIVAEVTIPNNIYERISKGYKPEITFKTISNDESKLMTTKRAIDTYLSTFNLVFQKYKEEEKILSEQEIVNKTDELLSKNQNEVNVITNIGHDMVAANLYLNFVSYVLINAIFGLLAPILISMRRKEVYSRMVASSYSNKKISREIWLSSAVISIGSMFVVFLLLISFNPALLTNIKILYIFINILLYTLSSVAVVLLFSYLIKSHVVIGAVSVVFSLVQSFLIGAFIPRFLLSDGVLIMGHVFPGYYFISNNEILANNGNVGIRNLWVNWLIMALFTIFISIAIVVINRVKMKRHE